VGGVKGLPLCSRTHEDRWAPWAGRTRDGGPQHLTAAIQADVADRVGACCGPRLRAVLAGRRSGSGGDLFQDIRRGRGGVRAPITRRHGHPQPLVRTCGSWRFGCASSWPSSVSTLDLHPHRACVGTAPRSAWSGPWLSAVSRSPTSRQMSPLTTFPLGRVNAGSIWSTSMRTSLSPNRSASRSTRRLPYAGCPRAGSSRDPSRWVSLTCLVSVHPRRWGTAKPNEASPRTAEVVVGLAGDVAVG
jgi:hypothetical protein